MWIALIQFSLIYTFARIRGFSHQCPVPNLDSLPLVWTHFFKHFVFNIFLMNAQTLLRKIHSCLQEDSFSKINSNFICISLFKIFDLQHNLGTLVSPKWQCKTIEGARNMTPRSPPWRKTSFIVIFKFLICLH